uniref:Ig-like domain-containing protein n=1 Tax=Coturnix japonica TaxID=93934 RepID=A0A8C2UBP2_COTJA
MHRLGEKGIPRETRRRDIVTLGLRIMASNKTGTGISVTCLHPSIQGEDNIQWYRQLPGQSPAFLVSAFKGSKEVPDPLGRLSVSEDRRSSSLWLSRPRIADAAVYYCAVNPREAKPRLRPGTNRFGGRGKKTELKS